MTEKKSLPAEHYTYTLTDLFVYLWNRRTILLVVNIIGMAVALLVTWLSPPSYTATMVVIDNAQSPATNQLSQLASLAGHASLFGNTGNQQDFFNDFITLYRSQVIAELADEKYHIRRKIFSSNWDIKTKSWDMSAHTVPQYAVAAWHIFIGKPVLSEPTYAATSTWLTRNISLTVDQETGQWTARLISRDPQFAQWLLKILYQTTESYLRTTQKEQSQQQLAYLNKRLSQITVEDYRQSLLDLISSQEKSLMLLESDAPVAARLVLPPLVTDQATGPTTLLNLGIGLFVSIFLSILVVVWLDWRHSISEALDHSYPAEEEITARRWITGGLRKVRVLRYRAEE